MTNYQISLGYVSGYSGHGTWADIKQIAKSITPVELKQEYLEYETIVECAVPGTEALTLDRFIAQHLAYEDATIRYVEEDDLRDCDLFDDDATPYITLAASGGCDCRRIKEGLRRAFCRLMLHKAHRQRIELNIRVV